MKQRVFWMVLLLVSLAVFLSGCEKAADNKNSGTAAASPTAETVDTAAIEAALTKIENDWPRIIKEKDVDSVKRTEAEDAVFVYPDGTTGDKSVDLHDIETGALSADSWEITELKVNVLNKDAAVVTGHSIVKNGKYKLANGKSIDISGQYRFIDTYARRNGQWLLVAGATTPVRETPPTPAPVASPAASPAAKASPILAPGPDVVASPAAKAMGSKAQMGAKPVVKPTP
jgi:hypothetical protein